MSKKEEFESARLMDFEFRQRARATRLLAQSLGLNEQALVTEIAITTEQGLLAKVAVQLGTGVDAVANEFARCTAVARQELIAERGDPAPHRLG